MITLETYDYAAPDELRARAPAAPRDAAQLFVYDTATDIVAFDTFRNLGAHLPSRSFLVLNKTKVVPARVEIKKPTGGKIVALFLINEQGTRGTVRAMFDRRAAPGERLALAPGKFAEVIGQEKNIFTLKLSFDRGLLIKILEKRGTMPIPPYLRDTTLSDAALRREYQTIFARAAGSAAAPTASLHFTERVFADLKRRGVGKELITLHVGLGTFAPVTFEQMERGKLHGEWYDVSRGAATAIRRRKKNGEQLVAVGTTAVRALESAATGDGVRAGFGTTDLFIRPGYRFRAVDALITNFHVPRSSLMMLVDAFLAHKKAKRRILDLYGIAIEEGFRLFSFGDAMLIR